MEKKLIVNADDFGLTPGVSQGILQAHVQGIVSSTSAMMNQPDALEAVKAAQRDCPALGLGVHLVLTVGDPLSPPEKIPSLVDAEGRFHEKRYFIQHLDQIDADEVTKEWRAQIEKFASTGCFPDHLDSHHHISYFAPNLFERMLELAQEYDCAIREPFSHATDVLEEVYPAEKCGEVQRALLQLLERYAPRRPQYFFDSFYNETAGPGSLPEILRQVAEDPARNTFELMCHPAIVDDELRRVSTYCEKRGEELSLLQDEEVRRQAQALGVRLVRFADLD